MPRWLAAHPDGPLWWAAGHHRCQEHSHQLYHDLLGPWWSWHSQSSVYPNKHHLESIKIFSTKCNHGAIGPNKGIRLPVAALDNGVSPKSFGLLIFLLPTLLAYLFTFLKFPLWTASISLSYLLASRWSIRNSAMTKPHRFLMMDLEFYAILSKIMSQMAQTINQVTRTSLAKASNNRNSMQWTEKYSTRCVSVLNFLILKNLSRIFFFNRFPPQNYQLHNTISFPYVGLLFCGRHLRKAMFFYFFT